MIDGMDQETVSFQALVELCLQDKERVVLPLFQDCMSSIAVDPSVGSVSLEQDPLVLEPMTVS